MPTETSISPSDQAGILASGEGFIYSGPATGRRGASQRGRRLRGETEAERTDARGCARRAGRRRKGGPWRKGPCPWPPLQPLLHRSVPAKHEAEWGRAGGPAARTGQRKHLRDLQQSFFFLRAFVGPGPGPQAPWRPRSGPATWALGGRVPAAHRASLGATTSRGPPSHRPRETAAPARKHEKVQGSPQPAGCPPLEPLTGPAVPSMGAMTPSGGRMARVL